MPSGDPRILCAKRGYPITGNHSWVFIGQIFISVATVTHYHWAALRSERGRVGENPGNEVGKFFPCQKRQNGGRNFQKALRVPFHRSMGPIFTGRGRVTPGRLANRFRSRFGTNTTLLRGVIGPISTSNDCLNTVFNDVFSLCGSCRNDDNALPRSPREKH